MKRPRASPATADPPTGRRVNVDPVPTEVCQICGSRLEPGQNYALKGAAHCADCCMELRSPRARKTHWQYLASIKTGYLRRPGED